MNDEVMINDYVYNHLGLKDTNATKLIGHLTFCAPYGEDYEALEKHLKSITKKSGANKGQRRYSDSSIEAIIKEYKKYIEYKKGQITMNNNENMITSYETQQHSDANLILTNLTENNIASTDITYTVDNNNVETSDTEQIQQTSEEIQQASIPFEDNPPSPVEETKVTEQPVNTPPVKEKHKGGRPISTNRSERFTLYMNADVLKEITSLANLDNLTVTDLMNNLLTEYIDKRRKDIEFMKELERMKAEYLQNRINED